METNGAGAGGRAAEVRLQLDRIARSTSMAGAPRLQALLTYTVEQVLSGRGAELKETVIGAEVFERSGHDPRLDSIVRVTCSKLRAKLREYYLTEGRGDPLEIEFPKGGYAPVLRWRNSSDPAARPGPRVVTLARRIPGFVWGVIVSAGVVAGLAVGFWPRDSSRRLETVRFVVSPPAGVSLLPFPGSGRALISPDGKVVAAMALDGEAARILIRPLNSLGSRLLAVRGRPVLLAWSPDSRSLAFYGDGKLWRIDTAGGTQLEIADAHEVHSAAWSPDGQLVFSSPGAGGLYQVPVKGGAPTRLTDLDSKSGEIQHGNPHFLPDGEGLVYTAINADENESTIYRIRMRAPATRTALVKAHSNGGVLDLADGRTLLLYVKGRSLIAQEFDSKRQSLAGEPFVLEANTSYYPFFAMSDFSAAGGVVIHRSANVTSARKLIVVDRAGKLLAENASVGVERFPRISPDGASIAVERLSRDSSRGNLWVAPLDRLWAAGNRVTTDPAGGYGPVWSPDSQFIIYGTRRVQKPGLYRWSVRDGSEHLVTGIQGTPTDWSPDGEWVVFNRKDSTTSYDIWVVRAGGGSEPVAFRATRYDEVDARFSPQGGLVAYSSNESGVWEVYVEHFPAPGSERVRLQVARGYTPSWAKGGRELIFVDGNSVNVVHRLVGDGVRFSEPQRLFSTAEYHRGFGYDVSADGSRFIFSAPAERPQAGADISVLLWR